MSEFVYKARARSGKVISGQIGAASKREAQNRLLNRGLKPIVLTAVTATAKAGSGTPGLLNSFIYRDKSGNIQLRLGDNLPTTKELAVFTKQFSLMVENGLPMLQSMALLREQQRKDSMRDAIGVISDSVAEGSTLHEALGKFPKIFDSLYTAMVRAGEASGRLDVILRQLVQYIEKAAKIKAQIKSAMMYPIIIVVVSVAVVALLLAFVVPALAKQFADSGQQLPAVTQMVVGASDLVINNWPILIGLVVVAMLGFRSWVNTEKGRKLYDTYILKAPVIGDVMTKIAIGRFCSTMGTMLSWGVSILEALSICATSSGNKRIEQFVNTVREEISKGRNFADPLMEAALFPKMVSSMVAVGEATGTLDDTLKKITEIYEDEVDTSIDTMTGMIEPIMIVVIGSIVGFIVIAMYLPIFEMANTVGG